MDPAENLPIEVFEHILSYLDLEDLMSCGLVSHKWHIAATSDALWKGLCLQNDWLDCGSLKEYLNCFSFLPADDKTTFLNMGEWRRHFILKNQLKINWHTGNSLDFVLSPVGNDSTVDVVSVSSDGHNIIAFGFDNGVVKLFDLKKEGKLMVTKECMLPTSVTHIQILHDCVFVMQDCLFQVFKMNDDSSLELFCLKIVKGSSIINVDIPTLMLLNRNDRIVVINDSKGDEYAIFHNDNYLVSACLFSNMVYVLDLKYNFLEEDGTFDLNIDFSDSFFSNIHVKDGILYVLIGRYKNLGIQAYSVRSKTMLYDQNIAAEDFIEFASAVCVIESNDVYLLIRFDFDTYFLLERDTGKVLLKDNGIIFLNANSNSKLVGIMLNEIDTFQIIDPSTGDIHNCLTVDGLPLATFWNIVITVCLEFSSECVPTAEVEFWDLHNCIKEIDSLKFPNSSSVTLLYKDETKLIFYASQDHCLVRNYIV